MGIAESQGTRSRRRRRSALGIIALLLLAALVVVWMLSSRPEGSPPDPVVSIETPTDDDRQRRLGPDDPVESNGKRNGDNPAPLETPANPLVLTGIDAWSSATVEDVRVRPAGEDSEWRPAAETPLTAGPWAAAAPGYETLVFEVQRDSDDGDDGTTGRAGPLSRHAYFQSGWNQNDTEFRHVGTLESTIVRADGAATLTVPLRRWMEITIRATLVDFGGMPLPRLGLRVVWRSDVAMSSDRWGGTSTEGVCTLTVPCGSDGQSVNIHAAGEGVEVITDLSQPITFTPEQASLTIECRATAQAYLVRVVTDSGRPAANAWVRLLEGNDPGTANVRDEGPTNVEGYRVVIWRRVRMRFSSPDDVPDAVLAVHVAAYHRGHEIATARVDPNARVQLLEVQHSSETITVIPEGMEEVANLGVDIQAMNPQVAIQWSVSGIGNPHPDFEEILPFAASVTLPASDAERIRLVPTATLGAYTPERSRWSIGQERTLRFELALASEVTVTVTHDSAESPGHHFIWYHLYHTPVDGAPRWRAVGANYNPETQGATYGSNEGLSVTFESLPLGDYSIFVTVFTSERSARSGMVHPTVGWATTDWTVREDDLGTKRELRLPAQPPGEGGETFELVGDGRPLPGALLAPFHGVLPTFSHPGSHDHATGWTFTDPADAHMLSRLVSGPVFAANEDGVITLPRSLVDQIDFAKWSVYDPSLGYIHGVRRTGRRLRAIIDEEARIDLQLEVQDDTGAATDEAATRLVHIRPAGTGPHPLAGVRVAVPESLHLSFYLPRGEYILTAGVQGPGLSPLDSNETTVDLRSGAGERVLLRLE